MSAKPTAGPWAVDGQRILAMPSGVTIGYCVESCAVGVDGSYYVPRDAATANAALMAEAPALLAELRSLCEWMEAAEDEGMLGDRPKAAIRSALAAIARAEGKP